MSNRTFVFRFSLLGVMGICTILLGCTPSSDATNSPNPSADTLSVAVADTATFAGGCFWCMEPPFDRIDGVASTTSGFAGGTVEDPSYQQVAGGRTDHTETVQVVYDSSTVDYKRLLRVYWHNVDPFDAEGQFCDRGRQYRPAIFVHNDRQQRLAEESMALVRKRFENAIAVNIHPLDAFYTAEKYHQNYYEKNPRDYKEYRRGCRRDARLREIWGDAAGRDASLSR